MSLSAKRAILARGLWRNKAGMDLILTRPIVGGVEGYRTLGGIWEAEAPDPIFGSDWYLVTPESMAEAGYELVEPEAANS